MVVVKVSHCREVRRFLLESTTVTFADFRARIARLFGEEAADKLLLRYQDKDGDFVSVSSDEELQEAFRQLEGQEGDTVRFCMTVKGERPGSWWGSGDPHHSPYPPRGGHGFGTGRGHHGCPLLSCPAMRGKDGHCCPLLSCPAMYGQGGGSGGHHGCPFINKGGNGRSCGCPFLSKQGGCPLMMGRRSGGGCPMFSGAGRFGGGGGCPMFSGAGRFGGGGGCPMFSGAGRFGRHGGCPLLTCPAMTRGHHQESDEHCGGEGEHHGCPFFACPSMKSSHEQFYHPDTAEEQGEHQEEGAEDEHHHDHHHDHDVHRGGYHHGGHHGGRHHGWGHPHGGRWGAGLRGRWGPRHVQTDLTESPKEQ